MASQEETKALGTKGSCREKRIDNEEDVSIDSDPHHRRRRTKVVVTSDSDGMPKLRLNRLEKPMFGDRKFDPEL